MTNANLVLTLVYFLTIAVILLGTALYFIIQAHTTDPEVRLLDQMATQREVQHLIDNLSSQFTNFFRLPHRWSQMKPYHAHHTLSWLFIFTLLASLVLLVISMSLSLPEVLRISTLGYVASLNALFMTRQHLYYVRRTHLTYDAEHYLALETTQFEYFEWSVFNVAQIGILAFEFLQLLSFPIRDLLDYINLKDNSSTASFIIGVITLLASLSSQFYVIQFWFLIGVVGAISGAMAYIHVYNRRWPHRPISLYWVKYLLPLTNLFYLPILVVLIGSASCLSKLGTDDYQDASDGLLRCDDPSIIKPLYLSLTLVAYTVGYLTLTAFVTSFDRIPIKGEIHFRSQGVAFLKNMAMLLSIDSLLVANGYRHIRSILEVVIVLAMACFNFRTTPCFVRQINFWRGWGYSCILWVALVVMMNGEGTLSVGGVAGAMAGGGAGLLAVFVAVRYINRHIQNGAETEELVK